MTNQPRNLDNWIAEAERIAHAIRVKSFETAVRLNGCYLGQSCSAAEILATLFLRHVDRNRGKNGDMVIMSPAHYCLSLYSVMTEVGELSDEEFETYNADGSKVEMIGGTGAPGMPFTTGSLAQGLSQGLGVALARKIQNDPSHVFVYMSDGELQEGQTWEALMTLGHRKLDNVTIVLDVNYSQVDGDTRAVLDFDPVMDKMKAFNLDAIQVDGHSLEDLDAAFSAPLAEGKPRIVVAMTNISQGIESISDRANLHFVRFRPGEEKLAAADLGLL